MGKLFTLITIAVFTSSSIYAQISKGSILLGGGIGYSNQENKQEGSTVESKTSNFYISPAIGIAVKENLVVGGDLSFSSQMQENGSNVTTNKYYGAGIYMRKYLPVASRFYIFGQGRIGGNIFDGENTQVTDFISNSKGYNINAGIYPGISFQVNKKLHLETGFNNLVYVQYENVKIKTQSLGNVDNYTSKSFSVNSSLNNMAGLYVGFRLLIAR